ncbi:MAG: autotransporter assembly complex protein TamA [Alphaproteobacteria bacterium]
MLRFYILIFIFTIENLFASSFYSEKKTVETIPVVHYKIKWLVPVSTHIESIFKQYSKLFILQNTPPRTQGGIIKRAQKDCKRIKKVFAKEGYFDAEVSFKLNPNEKKIMIFLYVAIGPRYRINDIRFVIKDIYHPYSFDKLIPDITGLHKDEWVDMEKIYQSKDKIKFYLEEAGYPFPIVLDPIGTFDKKHYKIDIVYPIYVGFFGRIDETLIIGLQKLREEYVQNRLLWSKGSFYKKSVVDQSYQTLMETGLLGKVDFKPELIKTEKTKGIPNKEQPIRMKISATESPPRVLGGGIRYTTSEGSGIYGFWAHNNIQRRGNRLGVLGSYSRLNKKITLQYDIADFISPRQKLLNEASMHYVKNRAYTSRSKSIGTCISRPLSRTVIGSVGIKGEKNWTRQKENIYRTTIASFPIAVNFDLRDNRFSPQKGAFFGTQLIPYFGKFENTNRIIAIKGDAAFYFPFFPNRIDYSPLVLASFIKAGSLISKNRAFVPPDKRFYSGGSHSIRGYAYQMLGPVEEGVPLGGRSISEIGFELRFRTSEDVGFVTFVEGGNVEEGRVPLFRKLHWGGGFGFRYYKTVIPIRIDFAIPFKRRRELGGRYIDHPFQIYLSVGHAF